MPSGPLDDGFAQRLREPVPDERVQELRGGCDRERVEHQGESCPGSTPLEHLRPRRYEHEQGTAHLLDERVEQVEELVVGPVDVLDQHHRRPVRDELPEEVGPGIVKPLPRRERMQIGRDVQPQGQREVAVRAEPLDRQARRIALADVEVLTHHLRQRPVGDAVTVRETTSGALQRLRLLVGQPRPELAHEARLAHAGVSDDRHDLRDPVARDAGVLSPQPFEILPAADESGA